MPIAESYEHAQAFLKEYGKMLVGSYSTADLVEDKMLIGDEAQRDLWEVIKAFPYASRERQALPASYKDAIRAIHGDIQTVEVENSMRTIDELKQKGKCVDNIVPKQSTIPDAGRGAFATRFIPKGGLVAPAPVVHIADKATANMYGEMIGVNGNVVRNESDIIGKQVILNYMFGHPNSTMVLFPYSSNVPYINHHPTEYNAKVQWTSDFSFFHHEDWLDKPVEFLEDQWTAGLMLEFVALRDIEPDEEVFINYGDAWQKAWDEHVEQWKPKSRDSDYNNLTLWTTKTEHNSGNAGYVRADVFNDDVNAPIRTTEEQKTEPYPHCVDINCLVNIGHDASYLFAPTTIPLFKRRWDRDRDNGVDGDHALHKCNITRRFKKPDLDSSDDDEDEEEEGDEHEYMYNIEIDVQKRYDEDTTIFEHHIITAVPWNAIRFINKPYTSDVFLKKAFRHEMILPDEVWPKAWMNLLPKEERK